MEAQQEKPALAAFMLLPPLRKATVALDHWQYPFEKTPAGKPDRKKGVHRMVAGELYRVFDDLVLKGFREHSGNQKNGGGVFSEIDKSVVDHQRQLLGEAGASLPEGGLEDADRELLRELMGRKGKDAMPPRGIESTFNLYMRAVERFRVAGLRHPKGDENWLEMKMRVTDLVEFLAERGIHSEASNERRADS